ncbi:hypothetical protein MIND_00950600 [Mycena indigotica]|uniref:HotDog ACOT-type domain-containing protein n=1 Tax=Mycena indigotica TaxID=2126181 RepID=A0A8H6SG11_9AGAR|nr:uncharacterized protein MIND_00950600 [Mycena indigotica]KAF7297175.1 hypothetical protein MIND_00950600 [Mycena indigotica]
MSSATSSSTTILPSVLLGSSNFWSIEACVTFVLLKTFNTSQRNSNLHSRDNLVAKSGGVRRGAKEFLQVREHLFEAVIRISSNSHCRNRRSRLGLEVRNLPGTGYEITDRPNRIKSSCSSVVMSLTMLWSRRPRPLNSKLSRIVRWNHVSVPSVAKETREVTSMDNLLTAVRLRADPAFNTVIPMRVPEIWANTILHQHQLAPKSTASQLTVNSDPKSRTERSMHDSYCELVLPFGSSPKLLEQYTNVHGGIRTGMLMEHLDSLAGSISYKHMLGPGVESLGSIEERGFYIVTASVDRLDMLSPLNPSCDLRLSGQVIYTGKSSMEVAVKMEAIGNGPDETVLLGRFSMVCRDAMTHLARDVHPLIISTPAEQSLHSMGAELKNRRQTQALRALSRVPPSSAEAAALHTYYLQHGEDSKDAPGDRVWMGETKLEKCMLMFPQERNIHQKIFGGYLMRLAYELGFSSSSLFMRGGHIRFLSLDGIRFRQPVPIGSILRLTSHVLHSTHSAEFPLIVHIGVIANVVDVDTGEERTTNEFRFTWCRDDPADKVPKRKIVPRTYKEAMLWLEGKRALELADEIRGLRTKDAASGV